MRCNDCQESLSEYIDGALELGEQTKIESHLADCEACRAVRDDLLQIVHFSHQLPLHAPSNSLWTRIQQDLDQERPRVAFPRLTAWWMRVKTSTYRLSMPQLAAAAAALVIVVSAGALFLRHDSGSPGQMAVGTGQSRPDEFSPLSNVDLKQIEDQISRLSENVERRMDNWDPEIRESFEKNLYYVNQCLVECRHQLNDNPADDVAQELMLNAYREKVRLLEGFERF